MKRKGCAWCGGYKKVTKFYSTKKGLSVACKKCMRRVSKENYYKNHKLSKAKHRERYWKNECLRARALFLEAIS